MKVQYITFTELLKFCHIYHNHIHVHSFSHTEKFRKQLQKKTVQKYCKRKVLSNKYTPQFPFSTIQFLHISQGIFHNQNKYSFSLTAIRVLHVQTIFHKSKNNFNCLTIILLNKLIIIISNT